jgi:hypothetical protein
VDGEEVSLVRDERYEDLRVRHLVTLSAERMVEVIRRYAVERMAEDRRRKFEKVEAERRKTDRRS